MHFHFFGASVTAQSVSRSNEKTGYVDHFRDQIADYIDSVLITRSAYGSCLFRDMGRYGLSGALSEASHIIFFEWHTTGERFHDLNQWISMIKSAIQREIIPVVLVLPRQDFDSSLQKYKILDDLSEVALVLDLSKTALPEGYFRDLVHTTEAGAQWVASKMVEWMRIACLPIALKKILEDLRCNLSDKAFNPVYVNYKYIRMNPPGGICLSRQDMLVLSVASPTDIGFWGVKDRQTPDIISWRVRRFDAERQEVFDPWSHYLRESLLFTEKNVESIITIRACLSTPYYPLRSPKLQYSDYRQSSSSLLCVKGVYIAEGVSLEYIVCKYSSSFYCP